MVSSPQSQQLDLTVLEQLCGGGITSSAEGYDEDCLTLSIWTPDADDGRRPVLVWLHGGWFTFGSSNSTVYDGSRLATQGDVIVVGINHRLGALGHLWLQDVPGGAFDGTGNVGMLDIVAALEWIRDNIAGFGGDPSNVTVFGESGGAAKVSMLLGMPSAVGLIHRAIIQSGPMLRAVDPADASLATAAMLAALGADSVEQLQQVPVEALILAQEQVLGGPLGGAFDGIRLAPVLDEKVLPVHPFDPRPSPTTSGVAVLIGTARDEMDLVTALIPGWDSLPIEAQIQVATGFCGSNAAELLSAYECSRPTDTPLERLLALATDLLRIGSIQVAERLAGAGESVHMYRFDFDTGARDGKLRAFHGADLPFAFDNLDATALYRVTDNHRQVARQMSRAWLSFARTGDPAHELLPNWPPYDSDRRATMIFDSPARIVDDPNADERRAWIGRQAGM